MLLIGTDEEGAQRGILTRSDWARGGQVVRQGNEMPAERPEPVQALLTDIVVVRIVTESPPHELEIRQFGNLKTDGSYDGSALSVHEWQHPRAFSHHGKDYALLKYNDSVELSGWEYEVQLQNFSTISYMNIWAVWYENHGVDVFSANWTVSARSGIFSG